MHLRMSVVVGIDLLYDYCVLYWTVEGGEEMTTFGQRVKKAWKNINEIKPKNNEIKPKKDEK